jgi:hypothetical protein
MECRLNHMRRLIDPRASPSPPMMAPDTRIENHLEFIYIYVYGNVL